MALKNKKALQNFFNNFSHQANDTSTSTTAIISHSPTPINNIIHSHFRIFDDPLKKEPETNLGQSGDKLKTELETNLGHKDFTNHQTEDKVKTEPKTKLRTNLRQTTDKSRLEIAFSSLIGLQRKITLILYQTCKHSRDRMTLPVSIEHLAKRCETTKSSIRKSTQRLEKKGVIIRRNFKNGRGGWTQYELPDSTYQEVLHMEMQNKLEANLGQSGDKLETEPRTELRTEGSSSSSFNYKETTTTDKNTYKNIASDVLINLLPEWDNINVEPLREIGFAKTHLMQIASSNKLTADVVQDSIFAFAFDLTHNNKGAILKTNPLNYFMGILRSGLPYAAPSNYESPSDQAMRVYLERKRELDQKRAAMEKALMESAFSDWERELNEAEKSALLPDDVRRSRYQMDKVSYLRRYYAKEIWPDKRKEMAI